MEIAKRFWKKVDIRSPNECWEWKGASKNGYGAFKVRGKQFSAHRYSWILTNGVIPVLLDWTYHGVCVLHKCDNRKCVNPEHLFLGSAADNKRDSVNKNRSFHPIGELHPMAKLSEENVIHIRSLYASGDYTQRDIAKLYGVTRSNISYIVNRKSWKI